MCQSVEGLAELAGKLEGEVTGENYTVVPSKSDQRDSVKEGWHESAPNLADIGAKLVVGTSDHRRQRLGGLASARWLAAN